MGIVIHDRNHHRPGAKSSRQKRRENTFPIRGGNVHVYVVAINEPALNFTLTVMLPHTQNIVVPLCNPVLLGIFPVQNSADRSNLPE
jgi:hypothetical protein